MTVDHLNDKNVNFFRNSILTKDQNDLQNDNFIELFLQNNNILKCLIDNGIWSNDLTKKLHFLKFENDCSHLTMSIKTAFCQMLFNDIKLWQSDFEMNDMLPKVFLSDGHFSKKTRRIIAFCQMKYFKIKDKFNV
jgi:hypothetical protein